MTEKVFTQSGIKIRRTVDLLPKIFQTGNNSKFLGGTLDPLVQPGVLEKLSGFVGRRYGKTYNSTDVYLDTDNTLRSRYQLEPGIVTVDDDDNVSTFYDYLDFKNQLNFFGNSIEKDNLITQTESYSWNPPIDWDKFSNFREYYWAVNGPPVVTVEGQAQNITSEYKVRAQTVGDLPAWVFNPDGLTANPDVVLYRGQTYIFDVNSPRNKFSIRTSNGLEYVSGEFNPNMYYRVGDVVEFAGKLWRAKTNINGDGSSIDSNSQDWEQTTLDKRNYYSAGVTNNGIEVGKITFTVPYGSPDILFYVSDQEPGRTGRFLVKNINENTTLDVEKEILKKLTYKSSNNVTFTNGLVVQFSGQVFPEEYSKGTWLVEGVGVGIRLIRFDTISTPALIASTGEIVFDNEGFDTVPFDDATSYPLDKDYITINKSSVDSNPWSRYNRWFHKSVLEYSHTFNGTTFDLPESARAKRPIIEFKPDLQLFNHGSFAKKDIDLIDVFTSDAFSIIEGSAGYNIEGVDLFEGARVLFTADTDSLVKNKIYRVTFIKTQYSGITGKQIHLVEEEDAVSVSGDCVLVKFGQDNGGRMYHFDGTTWTLSQLKTAVNQAPLFDVYDSDGYSFSNETYYPSSKFKGTTVLTYKVGSSVSDVELGFSLSYLNIDNIGDILFDATWDSDMFQYQTTSIVEKKISSGFLRTNVDSTNVTYSNTWIETDTLYLQPVIDSIVLSISTNTIRFNTIFWEQVTREKIVFYRNGNIYNGRYVRSGLNNRDFTFEDTFSAGEVITIKIWTDAVPDQGYYEIPPTLENNPLNQDLTSFTFGQALDHLRSMVEITEEFSGNFPGTSNLRDISDYQHYGRRFLKHASLSPIAITLICDKNTNIIKSLDFARRSYSEFRNNFLTLAVKLNYDLNPVDFVDQIFKELNKVKTADSPFADSDMIGSGAYFGFKYTVERQIKVFALTEKFDLSTLSRNAIYVYHNGVQLLVDREYTFDSTFGFINVTIDLNEGDIIEIRQYSTTAFNFIPPTPTKLGLYKKFTPRIYVDDTYVTPTKVIQGHDGSVTIAYDDFRDELLLELEKRIYNNIKTSYEETVFNIDENLGGFYGNSLFNKDETNSVMASYFLKWVSAANIDYIKNDYFENGNSFTYNYSNMTESTQTINLKGYWRGIYDWFYDTDRPHVCPWEMLGFSEKPTWWEEEYGPAPYTSGNLLLWEDLKDGIIRQGPRAGEYDRYKRPTLLQHLPVNENGDLQSPLESNLAQEFSLVLAKGEYKFGDIAPVENAWRKSSEYPFVVISTLCLLRPFDFITKSLDTFRISKNIIGQPIYQPTQEFVKIEDIVYPDIDSNQTAGLLNYLIDYSKSKTQNYLEIKNKFNSIDVKLSNKISGFVDESQQQYILDSKNPKSTSRSVFVPKENFKIIFNVGSPFSSISYSAVLIEKTAAGWKINGYDKVRPYFNYYQAISNQSDPLISVGGITSSFVTWTENKYYALGEIVKYNNQYYRVISSHTAGASFESEYYKQIPSLPQEGAVEALKRNTFDFSQLSVLPYSTVLGTVQEVIDFIFGYEQYLKSIGIQFDEFNYELSTVNDWFTSVKEFMFWTKHNWPEGSLLSLSPNAKKFVFKFGVGVSESLLDSFYDYSVLKSDGTLLPVSNINVIRDYQTLTVDVVDTSDGIYFITLNLVLKEHVVIFDDRTVFNDVLYDKTSGYRQDRLKVIGYRTTDWDGDYTSPGFLFDNVNIKKWQEYTDYKLGDIVKYREFYWTSQIKQVGSVSFDETKWTKLDYTPEKGLVANFDYKINQFEDYYDLDAEGVGTSQRDLARHAIGYQKRDYLDNLTQNDISQFKLYQGFIKEKGTPNSITKVFDKLSNGKLDSIQLKEEWAFRLGTFGGVDQFNEVEFYLNSGKFRLNPQPILLTNNVPSQDVSDQYIRVDNNSYSISLVPFSTDVNPQKKYELPSHTAGYVAVDQVQWAISSRDNIPDLNISEVKYGDHVWVTFDTEDIQWSILRYTRTSFDLNSVTKDDITNDVTVVLNFPHDLSVDEYVGLTSITNLTGFYKVKSVDRFSFVIAGTSSTPILPEDSSAIDIGRFVECRFATSNDTDYNSIARLKVGDTIFIDDDEEGNWEVLQKQSSVYTYNKVLEFGTTSPLYAGTSVFYVPERKQAIASLYGNSAVVVYKPDTDGLKSSQILIPPNEFLSELTNKYGSNLHVTNDEQWLIVSSYDAGGVNSAYRGTFSPSATYLTGQVVVYNGKLWKATENINGDGSSITLNSSQWQLTDYILADSGGIDPGYIKQGVITFYKWENDQWTQKDTYVSPRPAAYESFGFSLSSTKLGDVTYLAVGAPGANNYSGNVYQFYNDGTSDIWRLKTDDLFKEFSVDPYDQFGYSVAYSQDGSTLVVGSPGFEPEDSSKTNTGKVYIYKIDSGDILELYQSVDISNISTISDIGVETLNTGDRLGYAVSSNINGSIIVVSAPYGDFNLTDSGLVYVLKNSATSPNYKLTNKINGLDLEAFEKFGSNLILTPSGNRLVVGAANSTSRLKTRFSDNTVFDNGTTTFSQARGSSGRVYVFEKQDTEYLLAEDLDADFVPNESFGYSISATENFVLVGSPTYNDEPNVLTTAGQIRLYTKQQDKVVWTNLAKQQLQSNISLIKSLSVYDPSKNVKIADIDIVDHYKGKFLGIVEEEIRFKNPYDPAFYSRGNEEQVVVDSNQAWYGDQIGMLWWNSDTAKWLNYEQGTTAYRTGHWNQQVVGSSVDIYEWIETELLPSEWSLVADTNEGLAVGISGQPLYPDDSTYNSKEFYDTNTGLINKTLYYYWVKNTVVVPDIKNRSISAASVAAFINSPSLAGIPYIGVIGINEYVAFNFDKVLTKDQILFNIQWYKENKNINLIHNEYQLLTEGVADSIPAETLERKWIDSLVGYDTMGNKVPDPSLSAKQKYGLSFRPRQSMFIDRSTAFKIFLDNVNEILTTKPFADNLNFERLGSVDEIPNPLLNLYDITVETYLDLTQLTVPKVRTASLRGNIIDGKLESLDILDSGFGYRIPPPVTISGTGVGAKVELTIDNSGRITGYTIINKGKKYDSITLTVRGFSVLVTNDETYNNYWTVYQYEDRTSQYYRSLTQGYDTTKYWSYVDWWKTGFSSSTRIDHEILGLYLDDTLTELENNSLVKVSEYGSGGWAVLQVVDVTATTLNKKYELIGRQNGTIQISSTLYDTSINQVGYDNVGTYDFAAYDKQPLAETRNIIEAIKTDILIDDLQYKWNQIFFNSIHYVFSEQLYVDWAFKTSFLQALHSVGDLVQKTHYQNDNLESFEEYLKEVKPYRTKIREYTSCYDSLDQTRSIISDFDLPPTFNKSEGQVLPVKSTNEITSTYPWKFWADNNSYGISEINVYYAGSGYINPPQVLITGGGGSGATAKAYIANGKVSGVVVLTSGSGYITSPTVELVGGNTDLSLTATAYATIGRGVVRSMNLGIKFDRISKQGSFTKFTQEETLTANGRTAVFDLKYPPTRDRSKFTIYIDNNLILSNLYTVTLYTKEIDGNSVLKGRVKFSYVPVNGASIKISYEKNDSILDSVDRINKFYSPDAGMIGNNTEQLMTGIDFGGVIIQGSSFTATGGWDALPWFSDSWDSVSANSDYYVIADGSTTSVELPYVPAIGQAINVYIKRGDFSTLPDKTGKFTRIDDPYYDVYDGSTVQPNGKTSAPVTAVMNTFVGNGVTKSVNLPYNLHTQAGDILIFRSSDSDGTVVISDLNVLDTNLSGGTLANTNSLYTTATGKTVDEILVYGETFISPSQVPAPEENIPGQVLDSVSIKVFTSVNIGAPNVLSRVYFGNGINRKFEIGQSILEFNAVAVYLDKIKQVLTLDKYDTTSDAWVNLDVGTIEFLNPPSFGIPIEIVSFGPGGYGILDYVEFVGDGNTRFFVTNARYADTSKIVATVNGIESSAIFINSATVLNNTNNTAVEFPGAPNVGDQIKILVMGGLNNSLIDKTPIRINQQTIIYDGSTRTYSLDNFVSLEKASAAGNMIVEVNGLYIDSGDMLSVKYNGSNNSFVIGTDPAVASGSILLSQIKVYINNVLAEFIRQWLFDGQTNTLTVLSSELTINDEIIVEIVRDVKYTISNNNIVFDSSLSLNPNDQILVTWFSEYSTLSLVKDRFVGSKTSLPIRRQSISNSFIWIYKNGHRLTPEVDYSYNKLYSIAELRVETIDTDIITVLIFGNNVYKDPVAYELYKDMLNHNHFTNYSINSVELAKELKYYDTVIEVNDASSLPVPNVADRVPGTIFVNSERIEYYTKTGNILGQLRRGVYGSAIAESHEIGSKVVDVSIYQSLPYREYQAREDFVSDGSTLLIGPLSFTPAQGTRSSWYRNTIPSTYGPCDQLEVFIQGKRLVKDSYKQYSENNGLESPAADIDVEADFSVNGKTPYIRLTKAVPAGVRITVIKRTGQIFYDQGLTTASSGTTLLDNTTPVANFLRNKTTKLPE